MTPSELSTYLRRIASALDNSKVPSRELVASDIQYVISRISGKKEVMNMVSKINEIIHQILLSNLPYKESNKKYFLDLAKEVWGENSHGIDIVLGYISATYDVKYGKKYRRDIVPFKNAWNKLMNDIENKNFWGMVDTKDIPRDDMDYEIISKAMKDAGRKLMNEMRNDEYLKKAWIESGISRMSEYPVDLLKEKLKKMMIKFDESMTVESLGNLIVEKIKEKANKSKPSAEWDF